MSNEVVNKCNEGLKTLQCVPIYIPHGAIYTSEECVVQQIIICIERFTWYTDYRPGCKSGCVETEAHPVLLPALTLRFILL